MAMIGPAATWAGAAEPSMQALHVQHLVFNNRCKQQGSKLLLGPMLTAMQAFKLMHLCLPCVCVWCLQAWGAEPCLGCLRMALGRSLPQATPWQLLLRLSPPWTVMASKCW
jgi:hypothetical protein